MQGIYHHKRMHSDIPNRIFNSRNTIANPGIPSETKVHISRDLLQYSTNVQKSLSKGKERSSTPIQNVKNETQIKRFQPVPKIKPKIGSVMMNISSINGNKIKTKISGVSPFPKKVATPMKNNQSATSSRNTSHNRIKPNEPKIPSMKKFTNIPLIKSYLPPKSIQKPHTNRDEELNLTNLSKNSRLNDTNYSGLISDRLLRIDKSNSKSVSRNSKNSSKSRTDTPKFKSDTIKFQIQTNLSSRKNNSSRGNSLNVLNNSKNINKTHNNLKSASNSKSPKLQPKISTLASKFKTNKEIGSKLIPKIINKIPKANNYTTIHAISKVKSNMNPNYSINNRLIPNSIDSNYTKLYHSLLNNSNTNTNINDISTNSSKIDQKIINNPSSNSIVSNLTNVTKEKDKNEFSYNIPYKCYDKDTNNSKKLDGANETFKNEVKFKEITTSPLIRGKNDVSFPGRLVLGDSAESKKDGKNLFDLFKKSDDSKRSLHYNQNPIPINIESYLKKIKSNALPKETKKNIKMIHEFSQIGYADDGTKKMNQDTFFKFKNLGGNPNQIYFGVCDGHGLHGHEVSGYLKENLPAFLNHQMNVYSQESIDAIIEETFLEINFNLHTSETIDTLYSGSTCVSLIYSPEKLICANVGDSRAVLGKFRDGKWINYDLTRDHKPSEKDEAQRIYEKGGRIRPFRDDETDEFVGPPRVWLKEDDVPGLAMSRSFGDRVASSVGVIAEPEITEYKFVDEDKFIIIASDGVWEFIESDECVDIIKDFYIKKDPVGCSEFLYQEACKRWMGEEECIDDITMVLIFLED